MLKITSNDRIALLLGYPLRLTPNEHKILLILSNERDRTFSYEELLALAFPFKTSITKNQLAVHVCNINKKASEISGRQLIQNPHKNGYCFNPYF